MNRLRVCGYVLAFSLFLMGLSITMLNWQDWVQALLGFISWFTDMSLARQIGFVGVVGFVGSIFFGFLIIMGNPEGGHHY